MMILYKIYMILPCIYANKNLNNDNYNETMRTRVFPSGFWFGASTAAYQIEGAWKEDGPIQDLQWSSVTRLIIKVQNRGCDFVYYAGKGLSIWDEAAHRNPTPIMDSSTGDVAADSYHLYKEDVQITADLGLDFYIFSISWPRILPNGFTDQVNKKGVKFYQSIMDNLLIHNIEPMVTMYHWDLPVELQRIGGWTNPIIVDLFVDYAKLLFEIYGEKVKYWITMNGPKEICVGGYGSTAKAPMMNMSGIAEYLCTKNLLLAHAKTYHVYQDLYRKEYNGFIGIAISFVWYEPASETEDDHQAAIDARMFDWGQYAHPIFAKGGNFPREVKTNIATKSAEQGYSQSRLPELTSSEVALIQGSADFLGVNAYTTKLAYRDASFDGSYMVPSYMDDMGAVLIKNISWPQSATSTIQEVPEGFFELLMELKTIYENPTIFITENGWSTAGGLVDNDRIQYLRSYIIALHDALEEGADIRGYSVRSLFDGFEWLYGYTEKFGLYEVDFTSKKRQRIPRKSAFIYKQICKTKVLDPGYEPRAFSIRAPGKNKEYGIYNKMRSYFVLTNFTEERKSRRL